MRTRTAALALWLFVIFLGTAFGAGLYEHRIVVTRWISSSADSGVHWNAEAATEDDTGRRFWAFVSTGPLTLLTLINLVMAWRTTTAARGWWVAAALLALAERLFTFSYFIPTMVGLMSAPDSPVTAATALRWSTLNYLRHVIVFAAWLASLKAFAILHQRG